MNNTQEPKHPSFVLIGLRLGKRVQPCRPLAFEQMIDDRLSDGARLLRTPCFLLHCPRYSIRGAIRLSIGLYLSYVAFCQDHQQLQSYHLSPAAYLSISH